MTLLGASGNFGGEEIVRILAARKETASFLSRKLIEFFCMDMPEQAFVDRTALVYLSSNQNIKQVLESDFRNVYASVLEKWLSADSKEVLGENYDLLDLFA